MVSMRRVSGRCGVSGRLLGLVGGAALRYARRFHGRSDSSSHGATFAGFATLLALMLTATAVSMVASWVL